MSILNVKNLCKTYSSFELLDVSFSLEKGRIYGFVGRNGAGKTTTIKSILNLCHPDSGEIEYFDMPLNKNELEIKQRIGYSCGTVSFYQKKKIKDIVAVTGMFYGGWNESAYRKYLDMFSLDENKCPFELSEGMKVKLNLLIALSHGAELLILDEPTSGLDPFSRGELLDLFAELKKDGITIFFSTHIISDLQKCADDIIYIRNGRIAAALTLYEFSEKYGQNGEQLEDTILRLEKDGEI